MNYFSTSLAVVAFLGVAVAIPQWYSAEDTLPLWVSSEDSYELSGESDEFPLADSDWQEMAVEYGNEFRTKAHLKSYKHDPKLSQGAQKWADKLARKCQLEHAGFDVLKQDGQANAENLAQHPKCKDAFDCAKKGTTGWFDEVKDFDCSPITMTDINSHGSERNEYYKKVGHYMNVMDMSKSSVGYGYAKGSGKCKDYGFVVARYSGQDWDVFEPEYKKAGEDINAVDLAKFAPCPNSE